MGLLDNLAGIFGGGSQSSAAGAGAGGLGGLLNSGMMGDIARNLLTNKKGDFSWIKGALLAGAGSMLWSKLSNRIGEANASNPQYARGAASTPDEQAERMIRALVYAAKADGHIDEAEKSAINNRINSMNIGREGIATVQRIMAETVDPSRIALGVSDPHEALELYMLSRAVVNPDQFMEKNYLDSLADFLNIPHDVREQVDEQVSAHAS